MSKKVYFSPYDIANFNDDEMERATKIKEDVVSGRTPVEQGNGLLEEIRKKYGYSGGADGSEYIKLDTQASGGFDGSKLLSALASGGNKWQKPLEEAARGYTGMSYDDFTKGDDYASLAKRYSENGQRAMNATLAEIAARTGGMASSYAATASQQSYNDYMTRLEEAARSMYEGERADAAENLGVLQSLHGTEEDRKQTLANWAYQTLQDQKADARYEREYADSRADADRSFNYKVSQDQKAEDETAKTEARDSVYSYIYAFGSTDGLNPAIPEAAGYDPSEIAALEKIIADEKAAKQPVAGGAVVPEEPEENPFDFSTYERQLKEAGVTNANDAKQRLIAAGFDPEVAAIIAGSIDWGNATLDLESLLKKDTSADLTTDAARGEKFALKGYQRSYDTAKNDARRLLASGGNDAAYYALIDSGADSDTIIQIMEELGITEPEA